MSKDTKLYMIVKCPDNYYEGYDEIIGYADNEASAQQMFKQAQALKPCGKFRIDHVETINLLFDI